MKIHWRILGFLLACQNCFAQPAEAAAQVYNAFGFSVLAQERKLNPAPNIFLSPLSLALALSMVQNGAKGDTEREMAAVLGTTNDFNAANLALTSSLADIEPKVTLEIANSLWIANGFQVKAPFIADGRKFYQAEIANVDFSAPETVKTINSWISGRTHGKIPKMLVPPLDAKLRMIVLDAVYFKGAWTRPFDKKLTRDQSFTLAGGQAISHPRMTQSGHFNHLETDDFQAVNLPYADGQISLYVFLPKNNLKKFLGNLTPANWEQWLTRFKSANGTVELPRFKLSNEYKLNSTVEALGMPLAFTPRADLSGIAAEPLYIGWVRQKTFVEVNEEGTEAAAVTGIGVRASSVRREEPPFQMIVDHPFFVAIREARTGAVLFVGVIGDPR